jgi:TIR domain
MSQLFISHSIKNNPAAIAMRDWLADQGFGDIFLDLDPAHGISPGERWERALSEAARRCEAVIFLLSRDWLASEWCRRELNFAIGLNKHIFGLLIEDLPVEALPKELTGQWQVVNLVTGADHQMFRVILPDGSQEHVHFSAEGLRRLKLGLSKAGLDPRFFDWPPVGDPSRAPYRGLKALEADDAGIFFGREADTIGALDRLRGLAETPPPRLMAILGASGAGKSSFLRAGLWPRLNATTGIFCRCPSSGPSARLCRARRG